jgi:hypothetical protein
VDGEGYLIAQGADLSKVKQIVAKELMTIPMHDQKSFEDWYAKNEVIGNVTELHCLPRVRKMHMDSKLDKGLFKLRLKPDESTYVLLAADVAESGPPTLNDIGERVRITYKCRGSLPTDKAYDQEASGKLKYFGESSGKHVCGVEFTEDVSSKVFTKISNGAPHFTCHQERGAYVPEHDVVVQHRFTPLTHCYCVGDNIRFMQPGGPQCQKVGTIEGLSPCGKYMVRFHNSADQGGPQEAGVASVPSAVPATPLLTQVGFCGECMAFDGDFTETEWALGEDARRCSNCAIPDARIFEPLPSTASSSNNGVHLLDLAVGDNYVVPTAKYTCQQELIVYDGRTHTWTECIYVCHVSGSLSTIQPTEMAFGLSKAGSTITLDLNAANHYKNRLSKEEYSKALRDFLDECLKGNKFVVDGITKAVLNITEQTVSVGLDELEKTSDARNVKAGELVMLKAGETDEGLEAGQNYKIVSSIDGDKELKLQVSSSGKMKFVKAAKLRPCDAMDSSVNIKPYRAVKDVFELSDVLVAGSDDGRPHGVHRAQPLLVKAGAGTGKTWLTKQLLYAVADRVDAGFDGAHSQYVPFLLPVQRLAYEMRKFQSANPKAKLEDAIKPNLLEWYIRLTFNESKPTMCDLLLDAFDSKRLLLILDGIDEASDLKGTVQDLIQNVLIPCQIRFIATSRPEGLRESLYGRGFVVLTLKSYSKEQQDQVLSKQLSGKSLIFVENVRNFGQASGMLDAIYDQNRGNLDSIEALRPLDLARSGGKFSKFAQQVMPGGTPVATVEQLHLAAAIAKPIVDNALMKISSVLGFSSISFNTADMIANRVGLILVPEKNIARSREKCADKYQPEVEDGRRPPPAASWCTDIVRSSFVCETSTQMMHILQLIRDNPLFTIIRLKNLFSQLDPTHFRRLMVTARVQLTQGDAYYWHNVEIQIHHQDIFKLKMTREEIMHTPYEYFRKLFGAHMQRQLDRHAGWLSIESRMRLWREVLEVPVLMALFILLLRDATQDGFDKSKLPTCEADLYRSAIGIMIGAASKSSSNGPTIYTALRKIAYHNHVAGRREFTSAHARDAILNETQVGTIVTKGKGDGGIKYKVDQLCQDFSGEKRLVGYATISPATNADARASGLADKATLMRLEKQANGNLYRIVHVASGEYLSYGGSGKRDRKFYSRALQFRDKKHMASVDIVPKIIKEKQPCDMGNATVTAYELTVKTGFLSGSSHGKSDALLGFDFENKSAIFVRWPGQTPPGVLWLAYEFPEVPGDMILCAQEEHEVNWQTRAVGSFVMLKPGCTHKKVEPGQQLCIQTSLSPLGFKSSDYYGMKAHTDASATSISTKTNEDATDAQVGELVMLKAGGTHSRLSAGQHYQVLKTIDSDGDLKLQISGSHTYVKAAKVRVAAAGSVPYWLVQTWPEAGQAELTMMIVKYNRADDNNTLQEFASEGKLPTEINLFRGNSVAKLQDLTFADEPNAVDTNLWLAFEGLLQQNSDDTLRVPSLKILDDVADLTSGASINFQSVHLSLQEFMCADFLAEQVVVNRGLSLMKRQRLVMNWDYDTRQGIKALFEEPRHNNMLKFLGQLGAADQILQIPGEPEERATWFPDTGLIKLTLWQFSFDASMRMITFTAGSILAGQATHLVLTGCVTPGLTEEMVLGISRFSSLEVLDMRGTAAPSGKRLMDDPKRKVSHLKNSWTLTWDEMVEAIRDVNHQTLKRVLLQDNDGALIKANPTVYTMSHFKSNPSESGFKVGVHSATGATDETPPAILRRQLSLKEAEAVESGFVSRGAALYSSHSASEYFWERGWEVQLPSGVCTITFVDPVASSELGYGGYSHDDVGDDSDGYTAEGWRLYKFKSSIITVGG